MKFVRLVLRIGSVDCGNLGVAVALVLLFVALDELLEPFHVFRSEDYEERRDEDYDERLSQRAVHDALVSSSKMSNQTCHPS